MITQVKGKKEREEENKLNKINVSFFYKVYISAGTEGEEEWEE